MYLTDGEFIRGELLTARARMAFALYRTLVANAPEHNFAAAARDALKATDVFIDALRAEHRAEIQKHAPPSETVTIHQDAPTRKSKAKSR